MYYDNQDTHVLILWGKMNHAKNKFNWNSAKASWNCAFGICIVLLCICHVLKPYKKFAGKNTIHACSEYFHFHITSSSTMCMFPKVRFLKQKHKLYPFPQALYPCIPGTHTASKHKQIEYKCRVIRAKKDQPNHIIRKLCCAAVNCFRFSPQ